MRWVQTPGVNFFDRVFRLAHPVEKVKFFDWISQSENSVKKAESRKPFFDRVRKPDSGFSRKRPFSTDKSDCVRNCLRTRSQGTPVWRLLTTMDAILS